MRGSHEDVDRINRMLSSIGTARFRGRKAQPRDQGQCIQVVNRQFTTEAVTQAAETAALRRRGRRGQWAVGLTAGSVTAAMVPTLASRQPLYSSTEHWGSDPGYGLQACT